MRIFFLLLFFPLFVHAEGWKIDAALRPMYYNHRQTGELADVTGSAIILNSYELSLHKKIKDWQIEAQGQFAQFPFRVNGVSPESHFLTLTGRLHWKENFLHLSRASTPFVEDNVDIKIRQLTMKWIGLGRNFNLWDSHWKAVASFNLPIASDLENFDVKGYSGYQFLAGIRYWQRLNWQKKTWNFNLSLFDTYTNLNLKLAGDGGSNKLSSHQLGLAAGLAKQF